MSLLKDLPGYSRLIFIAIAAYLILSTTSYFDYKSHGPIKYDALAYYVYLPALVIHQDLSYGFLEDHPDMQAMFWPYEAPNGNKVNKVTVGMTLMYLPFFLIAHAIALVSAHPADGFSYPYRIVMSLEAVFYLLIGLLFLRAFLRKYFSEGTVLCAFVLLVAASHLGYYASVEGMMSHVHSFALFSIFLFLTDRWYDQPSVRRAVPAGLVVGLITLIRPTNVLIAIFFICYGLTGLAYIRNRLKLFLAYWRALGVLMLSAFAVLFIQMILWKQATGHWVFYSYGEEGFNFLDPALLNGLFGYRKGWLLYTPLMLFAILGILFLRGNRRGLVLPVVLFGLVNTYVILSWWSWWYGGSFGNRAFIESYAVLSIGLCGFIGWLNARRIRWLPFAPAILFILLLYQVQLSQYRRAILHWDGMNKDLYWQIFMRTQIDHAERQQIWDDADPVPPTPGFE